MDIVCQIEYSWSNDCSIQLNFRGGAYVILLEHHVVHMNLFELTQAVPKGMTAGFVYSLQSTSSSLSSFHFLLVR